MSVRSGVGKAKVKKERRKSEAWRVNKIEQAWIQTSLTEIQRLKPDAKQQRVLERYAQTAKTSGGAIKVWKLKRDKAPAAVLERPGTGERRRKSDAYRRPKSKGG